jgi:hypothetical protein
VGVDPYHPPKGEGFFAQRGSHFLVSHFGEAADFVNKRLWMADLVHRSLPMFPKYILKDFAVPPDLAGAKSTNRLTNL